MFLVHYIHVGDFATTKIRPVQMAVVETDYELAARTIIEEWKGEGTIRIVKIERVG